MVTTRLGQNYDTDRRSQFWNLIQEFDQGDGPFAPNKGRARHFKGMGIDELAGLLNEPANLLAREATKIFKPEDRQTLFAQSQDSDATLVDPEIMKKVYGDVGNYLKTLEGLAELLDRPESPRPAEPPEPPPP